MGADERQRSARQAEGPPQRLRGALGEDRNVSSTRSRSTFRRGPRLGGVVIEAENVRKSFGDRMLIDGLSFSLPRLRSLE